jgi:hypothetical protein
VRAETVEAEAQDLPGCLGGETTPVVDGVEDETDLALAVLGAPPEQGEVADQRAGLA